MESLDSGINTGIPYFFTHNTFLKSFVISEKIYTSQGSGSGGDTEMFFCKRVEKYYTISICRHNIQWYILKTRYSVIYFHTSYTFWIFLLFYWTVYLIRCKEHTGDAQTAWGILTISIAVLILLTIEAQHFNP